MLQEIEYKDHRIIPSPNFDSFTVVINGEMVKRKSLKQIKQMIDQAGAK